MAKALMIQGTGSGVGKSVLVAGLCRVLRDIGIKVAPFKAQNMALNSFITKEGGEIGRAQAFQAEAAGIEPCNDINPVLLKATSESGCQVIVNGRVHANMNAVDYYAFKDKAWQAVTSAYDRLSEKYDVIVIEGAGSPAEINLRNEEIVNMRVARYTNAPVILVGDIDKGGVFASLYGTIELLKDSSNSLSPCTTRVHGRRLNRLKTPEISDADYIKAFVVNKFRGDIDILRPGLRMIEEKTGRPVIGVINYFGDLGIHEEDAIPVERFKPAHGDDNGHLKIVVLGPRYISNFTDFDPFMYEPGIGLKYSLKKEDISSADLIIVPGSKNTVDDLLFLRKHGIEKYVIEAVKKGVPLIGICGGYQMLGQRILDPHCMESSLKEVDGMGLLDISTTLDRTKITCQVEAELVTEKFRSWEAGRLSLNKNSVNSTSQHLNFESSCKLRGYEIHMGKTTGDIGLFRLLRITPHDSRFTVVMDGSSKGNVWGTYIHGLFDNDGFRRELLDSLRRKKGMPLSGETVNYSELRNRAIDRWADILKNSMDICFILRQLGMEYCREDLISSRD